MAASCQGAELQGSQQVIAFEVRVVGQHRRLHHIGVGRTYAGTCVILLAQDLHVRVVNATTGELLRELTIDPDRDYQPTGRKPGPTPK